MNSVEHRLTQINTWFLIEILSFYGYILAAIFFSFDYSFRSTIGWLRKNPHSHDPVWKHDFLAYYRRDLHWAAFVQILFTVNIALIAIDRYLVFKEVTQQFGFRDLFSADYPHPLKHVTYLLDFNHIIQMIFLKSFFDEHRRVDTKNLWVWYIHAISYTYILYVLLFTDLYNREISIASKMWIPLDIILTFLIVAYQGYYIYQQNLIDKSLGYVINPTDDFDYKYSNRPEL